MIGGYVVEGYVPVEAIAKLLADKPQITGIAAPGTPGMSGPKQPITVHVFGTTGKTDFIRS